MQRIFIDDAFFTAYEEKDIIKIYFGDRLFLDVDCRSKEELKRAVIQLIKIGASTNRLNEIFHKHRSTLSPPVPV